MNWLDPGEVEAWLVEERSHWAQVDGDLCGALEQFVRALAEKSDDHQWHMCGCELVSVARLLVKAMGDK